VNLLMVATDLLSGHAAVHRPRVVAVAVFKREVVGRLRDLLLSHSRY